MKGTPIRDHKGNLYTSMMSMCNAYGVSYWNFRDRRNAGYDIEQCLSSDRIKRKGIPARDHLGNTYNSMSEMSKAYGINCNTLVYRLRHNWSLEKALTTEIQTFEEVEDHVGNKYSSLASMAKAYNKYPSLVSGRIKQLNWNVGDALTTRILIHKRWWI